MTGRARRRARTRSSAGRLLLAAAALLAWNCLGKPGHLTGLALAVAVVLTARAAAARLAVLLIPGILPALAPRRWRIRRRKEHCRPSVPARLRRALLAADRRCVYCGRRDDPQLDHVRPWSAGGLTTGFNLAVLCGLCNKTKSNYSRDRDGYVHYRPWPGFDDIAAAAAILQAELRCRRSPARWARLIAAAR